MSVKHKIQKLNILIQTLVFCLSLFLLPLQAQTGGFRFAHLTDLHLGEGRSEATEDLLLSIAQINATDNLDFVWVTGDLTEEGDRKTLELAKRYLSLLKVPYYVLTGNHETKWSDSDGMAFAKFFGSERKAFEHKGILFVGFNSGPLMRMAFGHIAPQDLSWAGETIRKSGGHKPVVVVTHYPLMDGDVDNWYQATDTLRQYPVCLCIGGHYHQDRLLDYDGLPGVLVRSNLRDKEGYPGYGVYEVTQDSIIVSTQRVGEAACRRAAFSLYHLPYRAEAGAAHYPDYGVNDNYPEVKSIWEVECGTSIYSSPAAADGRLYVTDESGQLSTYQQNSGKLLWRFHTGGRIIGTPAVSEGRVIIASADSCIYAVEGKNGSLLWKYHTEGPLTGVPAIENGRIYIGGTDHLFRALDLYTGRLLWSYSQVKGYVETRPLLIAGQVIFGAWDNTLYALNQTDGTELWRWNGELARIHFSPAAVWPVTADGCVFIADPQRALTAIDLQTGNTCWRTFRSQVRESVGLSSDGQRIYAKTMNDSIVCYAAHKEAPEQLWATHVGYGYDHAPTMLPELDGIVYASTASGLIVALDGETGRLLWKRKVGNSLVNTVVPTARGVFYTSTDGKVGLLKHAKLKIQTI